MPRSTRTATSARTKEMTAAEKLDMADGVLDGKYYGKKIQTVPNSHVTHHTHNKHHHGRRSSFTSHYSDGEEQRGPDGKRLTAAQKLDMADGKMDGRYFGKQIMSVKSQHRVHREHRRNHREEASRTPTPPPPPGPRRRRRRPRQIITEERYEPVDVPVIVEERVEHFLAEPVVYHVEKKVPLPPRKIFVKEIEVVPDPPRPQTIVIHKQAPPPATLIRSTTTHSVPTATYNPAIHVNVLQSTPQTFTLQETGPYGNVSTRQVTHYTTTASANPGATIVNTSVIPVSPRNEYGGAYVGNIGGQTVVHTPRNTQLLTGHSGSWLFPQTLANSSTRAKILPSRVGYGHGHAVLPQRIY